MGVGGREGMEDILERDTAAYRDADGDVRFVVLLLLILGDGGSVGHDDVAVAVYGEFVVLDSRGCGEWERGKGGGRRRRRRRR